MQMGMIMGENNESIHYEDLDRNRPNTANSAIPQLAGLIDGIPFAFPLRSGLLSHKPWQGVAWIVPRMLNSTAMLQDLRAIDDTA